jgi:hypothetical protein
VLTRDERRSVHGDVAIAGEVWVVTIGGMRLQRRKARVKPSTTASGSSRVAVGSGTVGRKSMTA